MLSRIAEQFYWIGRYTERAENTARLLDVARQAALEGDDLGSPGTLAALLGGAPLTGPATEVIASYSLDRYVPESIATSVRAARENARTIREALPSEMWEALNTWHLQLAAAGRGDLAGGGAHTVLHGLKSRAYTFNGVAEGTMPREEGWDWLMLGRYLERLVHTTRVLQVRAPRLADPDSLAAAFGLATLLRSFAGLEAFRARHRAGLEPFRVVEFLLLDISFPRSALYAVFRLDESAARATDRDYGLAARREVGRLRAELEFREVDDVLAEGVGRFTGRLLDGAGAVHGGLVEASFARGAYA